MRWSPILSFQNPDLKRYIWLSLPIMIGFSVVVVDEWIVKNQASYLGDGILSYLQYGRTLMKVPIGVFGMAAGVAAYPTISRMISSGSVVEAYGLLCQAVRLILLGIFAAQVCMTVAGFEAVYLIWGMFATRFTVADAQATAEILAYLCLGLVGWAAQTVISRGFYALGSTWLPTLVGTAVAVMLIPLYVVLRQQWGANGLAVASAVAILAYVLVLGWLQHQRFKREAASRNATLEHVPGMLNAALRLAVAAAIATGGGLGLRMLLLQLLPGTQLGVLLLRAMILCVTGVGIYLVTAHLLGVRELTQIGTRLRAAMRSHRLGAATGGGPFVGSGRRARGASQ